MAALSQKDTRIKLQFVPNTDYSRHAGLVAVEAMARRFDLWPKLRHLPGNALPAFLSSPSSRQPHSHRND